MNVQAQPPSLFRRFLVIALAGFLFRAAFLLAVGPDPRMYVSPDSAMYLQLAENLAVHGVFSDSGSPPFQPHTFRTPGYPAFLSLFGSGAAGNVLEIVWVQALLGALTAGLLFLTSRTISQGPAAARLSGLGMAFDFVAVLYSSFIIAEAIFVFFLVLSMLLFARFLGEPSKRVPSLAAAGLIAGLGTLVRPVGLYYFLVPALVLAYAGWTRRIPRIVMPLILFLIASALLPALWMFRNKSETGAFTFTTMQGVIRAAVLEEHLTGLEFYKATEHLEARFRQEHPAGFASPAAESSAESLWATRFVLAHPKDYAVVCVEETVRLLGGNGMKAAAWMLYKDPEHNPYTVEVHPKASNREQAASLWRQHPPLGVALVVYLSLLAATYFFAISGSIAAWKPFRLHVLWLSLTVGYFLAVSVGFGTGARYRLPMMPAIFLLAGFGLEKGRRSSEKV